MRNVPNQIRHRNYFPLLHTIKANVVRDVHLLANKTRVSLSSKSTTKKISKNSNTLSRLTLPPNKKNHLQLSPSPKKNYLCRVEVTTRVARVTKSSHCTLSEFQGMGMSCNVHHGRPILCKKSISWVVKEKGLSMCSFFLLK
jgi:hypothetical protein